MCTCEQWVFFCISPQHIGVWLKCVLCPLFPKCRFVSSPHSLTSKRVKSMHLHVHLISPWNIMLLKWNINLQIHSFQTYCVILFLALQPIILTADKKDCLTGTILVKFGMGDWKLLWNQQGGVTIYSSDEPNLLLLETQRYTQMADHHEGFQHHEGFHLEDKGSKSCPSNNYYRDSSVLYYGVL